MGAAAYARGSKAIRESISRDANVIDPLTYVCARQEDEITRLRTKVQQLETDMAKARRLIHVLRITKHDMYLKLMGMHDICVELKRSFLAQKSYSHAYGVMILAKRLKLL